MFAPDLRSAEPVCIGRTQLDVHGRRVGVRRNLRNEKVSLKVISLTMMLITKLLTNPLAKRRSTADAGDRSPA
jgi:hypothetical protein